MPVDPDLLLANLQLPRLGDVYRPPDPARPPAPVEVAPRKPQECPPKCPSCGGLECFCRPRFFAGQLLTDEDLTRLDHYIVGKNKLHNRYLHGWGVVCGLEVVCDPCAGSLVRVRTGYALAPCGEDIVVCRDEQVDICQLINACRDDRSPICDDPWYPPRQECPDTVEKWVLAICYDERPSRGITPVTPEADSSCCTKCSCGGSGGCSCSGKGGGGKSGGCSCGGGGGTRSSSSNGGCGCGSAPSRITTSSSTAKSKKLQCEPTLVCEGYRFTAYRAPPSRPAPNPNAPGQPAGPGAGPAGSFILGTGLSGFGPLYDRLIACVKAAEEVRRVFPGPQSVEAYATFRDYLEGLLEFAAHHASHKCYLIRQLNEWQMTVTVGNVTAASFSLLDAAWVELLKECFCSAALPQCPDPAPADCVPLAVITVRRGRECKVHEICNWEERKIAVTFPNLLYWIPNALIGQIRTALQNVCCKPERILDYLGVIGAFARIARNQPVIAAQPNAMQPDAPLAVRPPGQPGVQPAIAAAAAAGAAANEQGNFSQLLESVLGNDDSVYRRLLDKAEIGPLLAFAQVGSAPDALRASLLPMLAVAKGQAIQPEAAAPTRTDAVDELRQLVARLGTRIDAQEQTIQELRTRRGRRDR